MEIKINGVWYIHNISEKCIKFSHLLWRLKERDSSKYKIFTSENLIQNYIDIASNLVIVDSSTLYNTNSDTPVSTKCQELLKIIYPNETQLEYLQTTRGKDSCLEMDKAFSCDGMNNYVNKTGSKYADCSGLTLDQIYKGKCTVNVQSRSTKVCPAYGTFTPDGTPDGTCSKAWFPYSLNPTGLFTVTPCIFIQGATTCNTYPSWLVQPHPRRQSLCLLGQVLKDIYPVMEILISSHSIGTWGRICEQQTDTDRKICGHLFTHNCLTIIKKTDRYCKNHSLWSLDHRGSDVPNIACAVNTSDAVNTTGDVSINL